MSGDGGPQVIVQEIKILLYYQIVYAQIGIRLGKRNTQTSLGLKDTNESPNSEQTQ